MKTVLIAGAGIIGLSTALELAARDIEVTVLERGTVMREASWAAAGMLAANDPENPPELTPFAQLSRSLYPAFLQNIQRLSGHAVPLRTAHTLQLCRPGHAPKGGALLSFEEAARRVPGISSENEGEFLWLEEASLDPRDLCVALPIAARAAGVRIVENCPVDFIQTSRDSVAAITPEIRFEADALVLCCGAWSSRNWSLADAEQPTASSETTLSLPQRMPNSGLCVPIKGQMLAVRMPASSHLPQLDTVLRSPKIYLVPRGLAGEDAGRVIIGATVEASGFDRGVSSDATTWLLNEAASLWPPIREARVEEVWTGIRPGTADDYPLIGPVTVSTSATAKDADETSRLWIATGHYRNGILLAPGTARVVVSSLLAQRRLDSPLIDLRLFRPSRFPSLDPAVPAQSVVL